MNHKSKIETMCRWLKAWRIVKGLTQEQVSIAISIDVSNFENYRCEPRLSTLIKLCHFYGLSLPWLLSQIEEPGSDQVENVEIERRCKLVQRNDN